jgi:hypothetical protein
LASTDLKEMLTFLKGNVSDRKLRLFGCACGRQHLHRKHDERDRPLFEVEERYADGMASIETLVAAFEAAGNDPVDARDLAHFDPYLNAYYMGAEYEYSVGTIPDEVRRLHCGLLRDIIGNPFRSRTVDRGCLGRNDSAVLRMAQSIYDERSFGKLPNVAEALEEAGCTDAEVLKHCREPGLHVRGCWVIDALLGKS